MVEEVTLFFHLI